MTVNEFLEVTTHNFYNILSDGITGRDIVKMLLVLSLYAATLCKTDSQLTKLFLVLFDKS